MKLAILAPALADGVDGHSGMSEYVHERMLRILANRGEIDESFARSFAAQIEAACRAVMGGVSMQLALPWQRSSNIKRRRFGQSLQDSTTLQKVNAWLSDEFNQ